MMNRVKRGVELKALRRSLEVDFGVTDPMICVEAKISNSTLAKIYKDHPSILPNTRARVVEAFDRIMARCKSSA